MDRPPATEEQTIRIRSLIAAGHVVQAFELVASLGARFDLSGIHLCKVSLSGLDLRGCRFRRATFRDTRFENTDMRGVDLRGADLDTTNFTGSCLDGACLEDAVYSMYTVWPEGFEPDTESMFYIPF